MKIIFLDFDGTIATRRVWMGSGDEDTMDPVALQILGHICALSGAKIVCTSTDVLHDSPENMKLVLARFEKAGFDIRHLHPDWACRDTRGKREPSILEWLSRHAEVKRYVIVDDGVVNLPHFVQVDPVNGILQRHFVRIAKKMNVSMLDVFHKAGKGASLCPQLLLPLEHWHDDFNQRLIKRGNEP